MNHRNQSSEFLRLFFETALHDYFSGYEDDRLTGGRPCSKRQFDGSEVHILQAGNKIGHGRFKHSEDIIQQR